MRRQAHRVTRGVTLIELLAVVTIIGILAMISLPNIYKIIQMNRIRSSCNDLLIKIRYARALAIKTHREMRITLNLTKESFTLFKPGHTEYDLLKDAEIASAVASDTQTLNDRQKLFIEKSGRVCVTSWGGSQISSGACEYYVGESARNNGIDTFTSTCPAGTNAGEVVLTFEASGVVSATCSITMQSTKVKNTYTLKMYKGGQMVLL
jgi:prepilin-type N-terminal cleavage/methylation domain-containing protein